MIKFYVTQIRLGNMTLSEVPLKWRKSVENALHE